MQVPSGIHVESDSENSESSPYPFRRIEGSEKGSRFSGGAGTSLRQRLRSGTALLPALFSIGPWRGRERLSWEEKACRGPLPF